MDPLTLAVSALVFVAGGVTAGATGKLGEGLVIAAQQWLERIGQHSPETRQRLAGVSDPNVIDVEILEEAKRVAADQPDVQAAMNETVAAAAVDSGSFPNLTKLAEKINSVNFGTITAQYNAETQTNIGTQINNYGKD
ncbi:MAG: hypothetical protein AAF716_09925 [Cyanobacteria bacterium P01_D01_bin.1]